MRQKLRSLFMIISFILFPVTIYYFSPYIIIDGAFKRIIVGAFVVFIMQLVFSMFFGRLFCSWLCPAGGLGEILFKVNNKPSKGGRRDLIKYFIWAPWIITIFAGFFLSEGPLKFEPFYMTSYGISVAEPGAYVIYLGVVAIFLTLSIIYGRRAGCHYICWMAPFMIIGTKIGSLLRLPRYRLSATKNLCIDCKLCDKKCPMSLSVSGMVLSGKMDNNECILCAECVDSCPKDAIDLIFKK